MAQSGSTISQCAYLSVKVISSMGRMSSSMEARVVSMPSSESLCSAVSKASGDAVPSFAEVAFAKVWALLGTFNRSSLLGAVVLGVCE